jgi:hypothetical protein
MTVNQRGEVYWADLAEMDPVERNLFSTWLGGLAWPLEKEDCGDKRP